MPKKKRGRPEWVKLYPDRAKQLIVAGSDMQVSGAVRAAVRYFYTGEAPEPNCDGLVKALFLTLKEGIDEAIADYELSVKNGKKGAAERWGNEDDYFDPDYIPPENEDVPPAIDRYSPPMPTPSNPIGKYAEIEVDIDVESNANIDENQNHIKNRNNVCSVCVKPEVEDVKEFLSNIAKTLEINGVDIDTEANRFIEYNDAKGWMIGNTPCQNWKQLAHFWAKKMKDSVCKCVFTPPTLEEVKETMTHITHDLDIFDIDITEQAERFISHNEAKGWMVGNAPCKDWRSLARSWLQSPKIKTELEQKDHNPLLNAKFVR